MRQFCRFLLVLSLFLVASCRYSFVRTNPDLACLSRSQRDNMKDVVQIYLGAKPSTRLRAKALVEGGWITCFIVNVSKDELVLWRGRGGYRCLLFYYDKRGALQEYYKPPLKAHILENIEILEPLYDTEVAIHPWCSTDFEFELPSDCARIAGLWLGVEKITFQELRECQNSGDLLQAFGRGRKHVEVEWYDR